MFENIMKFFKKSKKDNAVPIDSKSAAKERLHLVLMQDRANVSADFLDLMKQEIIDVIKKYIEVDENAMDVRLTNKENEDGTNGAPALYANIPILNIKNEARKIEKKDKEENIEEVEENENSQEIENEEEEEKEEVVEEIETEQEIEEQENDNCEEEIKEKAESTTENE